MADSNPPLKKSEPSLDDLDLRKPSQMRTPIDDADAEGLRRKPAGAYFEGASSLFGNTPDPSTVILSNDEDQPFAFSQNESVHEYRMVHPLSEETAGGVQPFIPANPPQDKKILHEVAEAFLKARGYFEEQNYDDCIKLLNEILAVDPNHADAYCLLNEAQNKWEEDGQERELKLHIQNVRREAAALWEKKEYKECLPKFKFLCTAEPGNKEFQRLFDLCQEEVNKATPAVKPLPKVPPPLNIPVYSSSLPKTPTPPQTQPPSVPENPLPAGMPASPPSISSSANAASPKQPPEPPKPPRGAAPIKQGQPPVKATKPEDEPAPFYRDILAGPRWKAVAVCLAGGGLLLGLLAIIWMVLKPSSDLTTLDIQSEPAGVNITIEGLITAQTPLHLGSIPPGSYTVRFEKEGYAPLVQQMEIAKGQAAQLAVRLQPGSAPGQGAVTAESATSLFEQGQWLEASQQCDALLGREPGNETALRLKQEIHTRLTAQATRAMAGNRWEEARTAWETSLRIFPNDSEAQQQLRTVMANITKKGGNAAKGAAPAGPSKIQGLHNDIATALGAGVYVPPAAGNAWDLIRQLESLAPQDPVIREGRERIARELLTQASRKVQTKAYEDAKTILKQYQLYFPETVEFRALRDNIKNEEGRQTEQKSAMIQKAETAYAAGRYVTPANDNAVAYCNRVLSLDPQNQIILNVKRDSFNKALAQARELLKRWKFDEAHALYAALLHFGQSESQFPLDQQELRTETEKTEFKSFDVVHEHTIGSCVGKLRVNGYVLIYAPSGTSNDGFTEKVSDIQQLESGDKLKIKLPAKQYRFHANGTLSKEDNRQKIQVIYEELKRLAPNA